MNIVSDKQTVLVVDDTPVNIDVLKGVLQPCYHVKVAINGATALKVAQGVRPPDIILLDIMMPEMDGYEVCRRLKADPETAEIPVIFITAKGEEEDERRGLDLGAVDYIVKPFSPVIVKARVQNHLAQYTRRRALSAENRELKQKATGGFSVISKAELERLAQAGESDRVEFKSTLRWNLHTDKADKSIENQCLKTIAAYLNSEGGLLLVGVDDRGTALGLGQDRFSNEDKLMLHWNSLFKKHIGVEFIRLVRSGVHDMQGQRVFVVEVLGSREPVFFRRENEESFYVRTGNSTQQLKPSEVIAYLGQRQSSLEGGQ